MSEEYIEPNESSLTTLVRVIDKNKIVYKPYNENLIYIIDEND